MTAGTEAPAIKERPIIFSGQMVQAILEGKKTQTRRRIRWSDKTAEYDGCSLFEQKDGTYWPYNCWDGNEHPIACPYGCAGERLWVRETFRTVRPFTGDLGHDMTTTIVRYYADDHPKYRDQDKWKPSIHMPRSASRITLGVASISVERLQDIGTGDCIREGIWVEPPPGATQQKYPEDLADWSEERREEWFQGAAKAMYMSQCYHEGQLRDKFHELWNGIHGDDDWQENPWVWVVGFNIIKGVEGGELV